MNSAATSAVTSAPPTRPVYTGGIGVSTNSSNPSQPLVGDLVTCDHGTWSGGGMMTYTYTFIWGGTLTQLTSVDQSDNTYTIQSSDIGHTVACMANATNSVGKTNMAGVSSGTSPVVGPPVYTSGARLSSTGSLTSVSVGDLLSVGTNGGWTGSAMLDFTYQWQYSTDGSTWNDIPAETNNTYTVGSYSGDYLQLVITATDAAGSTPHAVQLANPVN